MNGRNNGPAPFARLGVARALLEFIVMVIYFFIVLLITPFWLILVLCRIDIGNPWVWLNAKLKMASGDYEGAAEVYEKEARKYEKESQMIDEQYNLDNNEDDEDDEADALRKEFIAAVGEPDEMNAASQLLGLAQKGYFSAPEYEYEEYEDVDGNIEWECTISILEFYTEFVNRSRDKKDAKRMCAYEMYKEILNNPLDE